MNGVDTNKSMHGPMRLAVVVALAFGSSMQPIAVMAADDPTPQASARPAPNILGAAREHVAAARWPAALQELKRVNARRDADWNNLMGYALRKQSAPDLAAAEGFYEEALRINPNHLGALEYSGELLLMKGELDKAELRLARLAKACNNCEELRDLKEATTRFKAAGNRYVAK